MRVLQETHVPGLIHVKVIQFVEDPSKIEELERILKNQPNWRPGWVHHRSRASKNGGIRHQRTEIQKNAHEIHKLASDIKEYVGGNFENYILANRYTYCEGCEDQDVQIFAHQDTEFGYHGTIVGFSLGETSIFHLSRVDPFDDNNDDHYFSLKAGSVYIMSPPTNGKFTHEVRWRQLPEPSTDRCERISMTFRIRCAVLNFMDDALGILEKWCMGRRNPQYQTILDQMGIHDVPTLTERIKCEGEPAVCGPNTVLGELRGFKFPEKTKKNRGSTKKAEVEWIVIDDKKLQKLYEKAKTFRSPSLPLSSSSSSSSSSSFSSSSSSSSSAAFGHYGTINRARHGDANEDLMVRQVMELSKNDVVPHDQQLQEVLARSLRDQGGSAAYAFSSSSSSSSSSFTSTASADHGKVIVVDYESDGDGEGETGDVGKADGGGGGGGENNTTGGRKRPLSNTVNEEDGSGGGSGSGDVNGGGGKKGREERVQEPGQGQGQEVVIDLTDLLAIAE